MHVGVQLEGSKFKPGMVSGHGWVEHGSSQVIWSSNKEFRSAYELLMQLFECVGSAIKKSFKLQV